MSVQHTKMMLDAKTDCVWFSEWVNILKVSASAVACSTWTRLLAIFLFRLTVLWPNQFCFLENVGMFTVIYLEQKCSLLCNDQTQSHTVTEDMCIHVTALKLSLIHI